MESDPPIVEHDGLGLTSYEVAWRDLYSHLESHGYLLRPRYRPDWQPSWKSPPACVKMLTRNSSSVQLSGVTVTDATRISDGKLVCLKKVLSASEELEICRYFSSEALRQDPCNHCIPLLDVLPHPTDPNISFMVMPYLRYIDDPPFETIEDVMECGEQILEGLLFMHEHNVAHRDCAYNNVMMDATALYPRGFHPILTHSLPGANGYAPVLSRSGVRVKYFFLDFGISTRFSPDDTSRKVLGVDGLEETVPELSNEVPYDPFKTDVYIVGKLFRQVFLEKFSNVEMIAPLVASMTAIDPGARPEAADALQNWKSIRRKSSALQKSWRVKPRNESLLGGVFRDAVSLVGSACRSVCNNMLSRLP
ncbi:hypothetical protein BV20DRAFT_1039768 [Pilatotrama ljubarskyi]|nr:hypothetical protein BV20DRAFT_1039768 [Pilatotrama ljubarskyi]